MSATEGTGRRPLRTLDTRGEGLLVAVAAAALYLLTLAGNHSEAEDGVRYAVDVRDGSSAGLSNSAHLAYNWLNWALYKGVRALGISAGPLDTMQVLNAVLGGVGVGLLWVLVREMIPGRAAAVSACGLLGFSFGYWFYSVEAEVYLISTVALIGALTVTARAVRSPSRGRFALLGGVNGVAVLCHNTNVLYVAVALTALVLLRNELPRGSLVRYALAYTAAAVAVVVPAYALAIWGLQLPLDQVATWLRGLTTTTRGGNWGVLGADNVPKAVAGIGKGLFGGHFAAELVSRDTTAQLLSGKLLREEYFMMRGWSRVGAAALLVPAGVVVAGLLVALRGWLRRPAMDRPARVLAVLCAVWFCVYAPFFFWWEPANVEFWVAPLVPVAVMFAIGLVAGAGRHALLAGSCVAGSLFVLNLLGSILPLHRESGDYWRVRLSAYEGTATPRDVIMTRGYIWANYLAYYTRATVLDLENAIDQGPATAVGAIRHGISAERPRRVLVSGIVFHPGGDPFARCSEVVAACRAAPVLRETFLRRARPVARGRFETVWHLAPSPRGAGH